MLDTSFSEMEFSRELKLYNLFGLLKGEGKDNKGRCIDTYTQFRDFRTEDFSLPRCLDDLILHKRKDYDETTLRGYLGEYCSRQLVESHLRRNLGGVGSISIVPMNKKGYVIGVGGNRALKASNDENVVLVEGHQDFENRKNGFRVVSEVDGLYCVSSRTNGRRIKEYIVVESKTGTVGLDSSHIFDNVISPYQEILKAPIHYLLVDFRERLFRRRGRKKLNKTMIENFYFPLQDRIQRENLEQRVSIGVMDFPFSRKELDKEVQRGLKFQENMLTVRDGAFNRDTGIGYVVVGDRTIKGRFIPD